MPSIRIEPARAADWPQIVTLLERAQLPLAGLAAHLSSALVARAGDQVVGCAALELYPPVALLRSVVVAPTLRGQGLGQRLTTAALEQARASGLSSVYLLTETAEAFFPRMGFRAVERQTVPVALQQSVEFQDACPASAAVLVAQL